MLQKIQSTEIRKHNNINNAPVKKQNNGGNVGFRGLESLLLGGVQMCERHPMVNVSVLDLSTAIVPRTVYETFSGDATVDENGNKKRKANMFAGMEAFRREASGLVINCLIPGFIVAGVAKLIQKPVMGNNFGKTNLSHVWANSDSLDKISKYYTEAKGANDKEKVFNTFKNMLNDLEGADGNVPKNGNVKFNSFKNLDENAKAFADAVFEDTVKVNPFKKLWNKITGKNVVEVDKGADAYQKLIEKTHIGEHIKFKGDAEYFSSSLEGLTTNAVKVLKDMRANNVSSTEGVNEYIKNAKKLVKYKSLAGLGVIIPLAISAQPINRWLTRRASGKKGAPIYDEFKDKDSKTELKLTNKEKMQLFNQKIISVSSMVGVALLSMMKKPSMKMLEFNGIFPSMDMARIVSTATFASRMAASEDKNELQLSTVRDISTFASMYFLGDYAAKGVATVMEKSNPKIKLLNRFKEVPKDANVAKKFWNWVKNTSLKSSDELVTKEAKNLRTWCQIGNIGFSLALLGIIVPMLTVDSAQKGRKKDIERQNALAKMDDFSTGATSQDVNQIQNEKYYSYSFDKFNSKVG